MTCSEKYELGIPEMDRQHKRWLELLNEFSSQIGESDMQKSMHGKIIKTIEDFQAKAREGKLVVTMSLTSELKRWFREHILVEDRKYADFGRQPGRKAF